MGDWLINEVIKLTHATMVKLFQLFITLAAASWDSSVHDTGNFDVVVISFFAVNVYNSSFYRKGRHPTRSARFHRGRLGPESSAPELAFTHEHAQCV